MPRCLPPDAALPEPNLLTLTGQWDANSSKSPTVHPLTCIRGFLCSMQHPSRYSLPKDGDANWPFGLAPLFELQTAYRLPCSEQVRHVLGIDLYTGSWSAHPSDVRGFCNKVSKSLTQGSPTCRSTCVLQSQLSWRPLAFPAMLCSSNTVLCFIHAFSYGRRSFCPGPTECRSQSLASAFAVMSCRDAVCSDPCVTVVLQDANLGQFRMRLKRLTAPSSEETNSACHGRPGRLGVGLQPGQTCPSM